MSWRWPRGEPKRLASFVDRQAGRRLPPLPLSTEDLRRLDPNTRVVRIAEALYDALAAQGLYYELDERYDGHDLPVQRIREPVEMLRHKRGTCLDLTLLYAGACITYELLPLLVVFEGHALVAICLTHDLHALRHDRPRLYTALAVNDPRRLFADRTLLQDAVERGSYLAVECTGFASANSLPAPAGFSREQGRLSFAGAVTAGLEELRRADRHLSFALDVNIAWNEWQIPIAPSSATKVQPPLSLPPGASRHGRTPLYGYEVKFVGRERELEMLLEFLEPRPDRSPDFAWWLWTAPGGQGKSRLAFCLCLEAEARGWRCGFLSSNAEFGAWSAWEVDEPTLVVVDHIAHRPETVRKAIGALSREPNGVRAPVRLLLLERPFRPEDLWVRKFVPEALPEDRADFFDSAYPLDAKRRRDRLRDRVRELEPLDADLLWQIVTSVLDRHAVPHPDRDLTVTALETIDRLRRPLFAILAAEAIATAGVDRLRQWDRHELEYFILEREFALWQQRLGLTGSPAGSRVRVRFEKHLVIVAFSTITGLTLTAATQALREHAVPVPKRLFPDWVRAIAGYSAEEEEDEDSGTWRLEPDLLGELFVLERLAGRFGVDANRTATRAQMQRLLDVGLAVQPLTTIAFIEKSLEDFPDHPSLHHLAERRIAEGVRANYGHYLDFGVYLQRIAMRLETQGRFDLAEQVWTRLAASGQRLAARPAGAAFADDFDEMVASALYNRALMRMRLKKTDGAVRDCNKVLATLERQRESQPLRPGFHKHRIVDLWEKTLRLRAVLRLPGEAQAALVDLNRILDDPAISEDERAEALLVRAEAHSVQTDLAAALHDYDVVLAMPGDRFAEQRRLAADKAIPLLWGELHRALAASHDEGGLRYADRALTIAVDYRPDLHVKIQVDRGVLHLLRRNWPAAIADFTAILGSAAAPIEQRLKALVNRSQAYFYASHLKRARSDVDQVLAASKPPDPDWATALLTRARIHQAENDYASALEDLRTLTDESALDSQHREMAARLASTLHRSGGGGE